MNYEKQFYLIKSEHILAESKCIVSYNCIGTGACIWSKYIYYI